MVKEYVFARLQEPSTWRGLIKLAAAFGVFYVSDTQADAIIAVALALAGAGGLLPDNMRAIPFESEANLYTPVPRKNRNR